MPDFKPENNIINKIHNLVLRLLIVCMILFTLAVCIFTIFDTRGLTNLGAILPVPYFVKFLVLLGLLYLICCATINSTLMLSFGYMYGYYTILFFISELRLNQKRYRTCNNLRHNTDNLRHVYRALQILHRCLLDIFGPYLLTFNAAFMKSLIYLNFVLIRYWSQLSIYTKIPLFAGCILDCTCWTTVIWMGKVASVKGNQVLSSWKRQKWSNARETRIMNRFRKSCKPLVLCCGSQFVITKKSIFTFYRGVTRGTFRALLTTKT